MEHLILQGLPVKFSILDYIVIIIYIFIVTFQVNIIRKIFINLNKYTNNKYIYTTEIIMKLFK